MPWEDPTLQQSDAAGGGGSGGAGAAAGPSGGGRRGVSIGLGEDDDEEGLTGAEALAAEEARLEEIRLRMRADPTYVPPAVAAKRAKDQEDDVKVHEMFHNDEEDALDAFMAGTVLPEVAQRQAEEEARKQEERKKIAEALAAGKAAPVDKALEDSESEEEPDKEIQIPANKVKLVIGPGGEKIKEISKKSKCRIQVKKDEKELNKEFGASHKIDFEELLKQKEQGGEVKMATLMLFGDEKALEIAERMIQEAVENKAQKQQQRQKEYDKKREAKRRERTLYHLRHAKDYELLELPLGANKDDVKKAYRRLAKVWHPDKHPENQEEAKAKFQEIQKAYDSLMSTNEDDTIQQLAHE